MLDLTATNYDICSFAGVVILNLSALFISDCDWYIVEYDGDDIFWGFAILNGDQFNAEWGYIPFSKLKEIRVKGGFEIDCEINWEPTRADEIEKIQNCNSHW